MLASLRGLAPAANGLVLLSTSRSRGTSLRIDGLAEARADAADMDQLLVLPCPRCTPTSSERSRLPSLVQPPITTSWPARHLVLTQLPARPER